MKLPKQLQIPLLMFVFANVAIVLGKVLLDPTIGKKTVTPFVFPQTVPLSGWQLVASEPLKIPAKEAGQAPVKELPNGKQYRYTKDNQTLNVQMLYELETHGEFKEFLRNFTSLKGVPDEQYIVVRQQPGVGIYGMFALQNRAYLNACINPRGGSTLTRQQYSDNRVRYDLLSDRLILWLIGQRSLRDQRCLWSHFSIPLNKSAPESTYATLEQAWLSWYQWWSTRYPQE
ncbi:cyanoexosortase A system-associated protein [Aliterella atlantica]|uniref:Cyanoexosortase A system-associated protein n=1 Tax=Aliterella atlantica CENA595 TaxID=1618023 RepID=A0A0D8ZQX2_9CYAN|nr:cyanoexosortase A system-associated protein [Aliterella atlantica]KJH71140.1 hypothetical protein UH38_14090 [Aliterella atlantica CENA595]